MPARLIYFCQECGAGLLQSRVYNIFSEVKNRKRFLQLIFRNGFIRNQPLINQDQDGERKTDCSIWWGEDTTIQWLSHGSSFTSFVWLCSRICQNFLCSVFCCQNQNNNKTKRQTEFEQKYICCCIFREIWRVFPFKFSANSKLKNKSKKKEIKTEHGLN